MSEEELMSLLESKICIPKEEKNMINRDELIDRLEKSKEEVVVFWAGAGFGKTALMAEFARRHNGHCGWYRINELDDNPRNFLHGICLAVSKTVRLSLREIREKRQKEENIEKLYDRFLSSFLLRLEEKQFYICIDDFQTVRSEYVYSFMRNLIEYGQGKVRLFFAVKGDFPKFLAAYLMRQRVLVVYAKHLLFSGSETNLLLSRITGRSLPDTLVESIQKYTRGWPAGVVFAGLGMRSEEAEKDAPLCFDESHLYDYIFYEIFSKLPDDIQKFLTETSVLGELDAGLCNYVLGRGDSEQILEYLVRENLFISKQKQTNKYCYFSVFADFLGSMVKAGRKEQIIYQASEYYAGCGEWARSAEFAEECKGKGFLQVKCLGQFSAKGPLGSIAFRTRKTRELFACLFFEEGRGVKRDILIERLWPETEREKASVLFYTTVSYLRKALDKSGVENLLVVENRTYALDLTKVRSDLALLMNWSRYARAGRIPENANIMEAAAIYHDCYMYGEDYIWLGEYREYVEQIFLQTMGSLAEIQMNMGRYKHAVLLLKRAAEVDPYAIFISELLVECFLLAGDIKGAKQQYQRMADICREELGEEPEREFEDLVKSAKRRRRALGR